VQAALRTSFGGWADEHMKKQKVFIMDAWDAGTPGMWSTFKS